MEENMFQAGAYVTKVMDRILSQQDKGRIHLFWNIALFFFCLSPHPGDQEKKIDSICTADGELIKSLLSHHSNWQILNRKKLVTKDYWTCIVLGKIKVYYKSAATSPGLAATDVKYGMPVYWNQVHLLDACRVFDAFCFFSINLSIRIKRKE